MLLLIMFGIPPVHHVDDPIRAIFCALRVKDELEKRNSSPKIGVTTGNVWVGTVGCEIRKEYTAMGDTVNLAARLMAKADWGDIICDVDTKQKSEKVMEYRALAPVKLKGKSGRIAIFSPTAAARGGRLGGLRPELELSERFIFYRCIVYCSRLVTSSSVVAFVEVSEAGSKTLGASLQSAITSCRSGFASPRPPEDLHPSAAVGVRRALVTLPTKPRGDRRRNLHQGT